MTEKIATHHQTEHGHPFHHFFEPLQLTLEVKAEKDKGCSNMSYYYYYYYTDCSYNTKDYNWDDDVSDSTTIWIPFQPNLSYSPRKTYVGENEELAITLSYRTTCSNPDTCDSYCELRSFCANLEHMGNCKLQLIISKGFIHAHAGSSVCLKAANTICTLFTTLSTTKEAQLAMTNTVTIFGPSPTTQSRGDKDRSLAAWIAGTVAMAIISVISTTANILLGVVIYCNRAKMNRTWADINIHGEPMEAGSPATVLLPISTILKTIVVFVQVTLPMRHSTIQMTKGVYLTMVGALPTSAIF